MARHQAHDELVVEIARWYREPTPEMGYDLVEGTFGWFNRPTSTGRGRGTVRPGLGVGEIDALVAEAQELVAVESLELICDDRATAVDLGPALEARDFKGGVATVFLAYVGRPKDFDGGGPEDLTIEEVPPIAPALWMSRPWTRPLSAAPSPITPAGAIQAHDHRLSRIHSSRCTHSVTGSCSE